MSEVKKLALLNFSREGGPGKMAQSLEEEACRSGIQVKNIYSAESSLYERPLSNPLQTLGAGFDQFIVKSRDFGAPISLFRDFMPLRGFSVDSEAHYILGWTNGLIDKHFWASLENLPTVIRLPDLNHFTGVCHYSESCTGFLNNCGDCPAVKSIFRGLVKRQFEAKRSRIGNLKRAKVVAPSNWIAELYAESQIGLEGPEVEVVSNPISRVFYDRSKIKSSADRSAVVFVASQVEDPVKGFDLVADSLNQPANDFDYEVRVIGNCTRATAEKYKNIKFLGRKTPEEVADEFAESAFCLVPSREETAGNIIKEAMAMGCIPITSGVGGSHEAVKDLGAGLSSVKPQEMVSKIMSLTPNQIESISQLAIEESEDYRPERVFGKYLEVLESL